MRKKSKVASENALGSARGEPARRTRASSGAVGGVARGCQARLPGTIYRAPTEPTCETEVTGSPDAGGGAFHFGTEKFEFLLKKHTSSCIVWSVRREAVPTPEIP